MNRVIDPAKESVGLAFAQGQERTDGLEHAKSIAKKIE
jgi:hypothetical protein